MVEGVVCRETDINFDRDLAIFIKCNGLVTSDAICRYQSWRKKNIHHTLLIGNRIFYRCL